MPAYDPYSAEVRENPYPVYRELRDEAPVFRNTEYAFYALSRYDDVLAALIDYERFTSTLGVSIERAEVGQDLLILKDPPEHTMYRKAMSRMFTPRRIEELEGFVRAVSVQLLDTLQGERTFDVTDTFAMDLPLLVIAELIGLPEEFRDAAHRLSDLTARRDPTPEVMEQTIAAMTEMREYLIGVTAERRAHLGDDVISAMIRQPVVDAAGNESLLTDEQISYFFFELTFAGHETTANAIVNGLVALSWYPDQRRELVADRALLPNAIEEIVRWDSPSQYLGRTPTVDVELHGVTIPAGAPVALMTGSANHDERHYEEPELFDIHRRFDRTVAFGFGPHVCIGAALARLEMRVAFDEFLARFPDFHVGDTSGITRTPSAQIRGLRHLVIDVERASAPI